MTGTGSTLPGWALFASLYSLLLFVYVLPPSVSAQDTKPALHNWSSVEYPNLPTQNESVSPPKPSLVNNTNTLTHRISLDLYLSLYVPSVDRKLPGERPLGSNKIRVRLHPQGGTIRDPEPDDRHGGFGAGNSRGVNYTYIYSFGWGSNALEEAWLEVSFLGNVYWLEVPYGFTRNPADPLPTGGREHGRSSVALGMRGLGKAEQIVHWSYVHYSMGRIQNEWQLDLRLSNPRDAQAEVILYREDTKVGKSMFLWDLHSPRTDFTIQRRDRILQSTCMGIRLHEDGMRRSDSFWVNRDPSDDRCWGTAIIKVDKATYRCVVPSSLFVFQHGRVDMLGRKKEGE
jgi:hypothetical protein